MILPTEMRQLQTTAEYIGVHNNTSYISSALSAFVQVCTYMCLTDAVTFKHAGIFFQGTFHNRDPKDKNTACV